MQKTILVLAPHPDDAEWYAGGTLARLADEGHRIWIAIATDGRVGTFDTPPAALATQRAEEARRAAVVLGAAPPILLGHRDFELDRLPAGRLREQFVRLIRQFRPDSVFALDPFTTPDPHPDHRAVGWAAADALNYSHLPNLHPEHREEGLEPHFVPEKYFYSEDTTHTNTVIDVSASMGRKIDALSEHRSQVQFLVEDVLRQANLAGLDLRGTLGPLADDPLRLLEMALQEQASRAGQRIGVTYGEAFRYSRFQPVIETLLKGNSPS